MIGLLLAALVPSTSIDSHPLPAGEGERAAADVVRLVGTTPVQSVAWRSTLVPEGDPAAPKGEICAARIRRRDAALERKLRDYVSAFNAGDDERYTNAIPNAAAADFLARTVPLFECPDAEIEKTYYYRWWTYRKHLRKCDGKTWVVSEFLPDVSWADQGTISCAFGHHVLEGRWLRDPSYVRDYIRFMIRRGPMGPDMYANWPARAFLDWRAVTGDREPGVTELRRMRERAADWERGHVHTFRWLHGDRRAGLCEDGLFHIPDNFEGTELSLGGHGAKPMINASRCAEYRALAQLCDEAGEPAAAADCRAKSARLQKLLRERLWSEADGFYLTRSDAGELVRVPELHGYAPWYFGLDTSGQDVAWRLLAATNGFSAPFGLTFPVRSAKGFAIDRRGHGCKWNGPSWPYATSVALTAYANHLDGRFSPDYFALLRQYAVQQRMRLADGRVVPWVDENLDPFTGEWLCRAMILANEKGKRWWGKERGRDYNHSTFCDLVISGLVGVRPQDGKPFALKPLVPPDWTWLRLSHLRYQGRDYTVLFDRDGSRYGCGKGWQIKEE